MKIFDAWRAEELSDEELREVQSHSDDSVAQKVEYVSETAYRFAFETTLKQMNENKFMNNGELRTFIDEELDE